MIETKAALFTRVSHRSPHCCKRGKEELVSFRIEERFIQLRRRKKDGDFETLTFAAKNVTQSQAFNLLFCHCESTPKKT